MERQDALIQSTVAGHSYRRPSSISPPPVSHPFPEAIPQVENLNWRSTDLEKASPSFKDKLNSVTWRSFKANVKTYWHLTGRKPLSELLGATHMHFLVSELSLSLESATSFSDEEWFPQFDPLYGSLKPKIPALLEKVAMKPSKTFDQSLVENY